VDDTATALLESLNDQRAHVLGILDGLDDDALHRPVLPTGWSCLGLVQHLALDVERFWFRTVMAGEKDDAADDLEASAWDVGADTPAEAVLELYRTEIERANEVIVSPPAAWPAEQFGSFLLPDLRAMLLHVITETACHAGHLDATRELLDGRTWIVL
jgi:uncharacterized damage-inducible protein DinB